MPFAVDTPPSFVQDFDAVSILLLAAQVAGVLAAGLALAALRRRLRGGWDLPRSVAVAALVGAVVVFVPTAWTSGRELNQFRGSNSVKDEGEKRFECTGQSLLDRPFIDWVGQTMPEHARYKLVVSKKSEQIATHFCIRYLLLPRVATAKIDDAGWMVFWEDVPNDQMAKAQRRGGRSLVFDPANQDRLLVQLAPRNRRPAGG